MHRVGAGTSAADSGRDAASAVWGAASAVWEGVGGWTCCLVGCWTWCLVVFWTCCLVGCSCLKTSCCVFGFGFGLDFLDFGLDFIPGTVARDAFWTGLDDFRAGSEGFGLGTRDAAGVGDGTGNGSGT